MLKQLRLPALLLAGATFLIPSVALAERRGDEHRHRNHRFSVQFGIGPSYPDYGYYDRWGYWHPYGYGPYGPGGFYDRWGYWHPYGY